MTRQGWKSKARELEQDYIAAGGFISRKEAEKIVERVYGPKPSDGEGKSSGHATSEHN